MKKLLAQLTLITLAGILFSSCSNSSKMSFTKRHYRSGYFADRVGKINAAPAVASAPIKLKQQIIPIETTKSENPVLRVVSANASQRQQIGEGKISNSASAYNNFSITNAGANNSLKDGPLLQNNQAISASAGDGGGERAALSLLWIVIVIILILWLIGLLAGGWGLGGLINLLLVIALILLILWLFRVI
jgi:hypothetical protein